MDADPFKSLLTSASREHLRRQAEANGRFVGNVFLPAITTSTNGPSASSLKHLKVIEQCIVAENKREEQLARCQDDKERRFWAKKFLAQRARERKIIRALMTNSTEIEITDVAAAEDAQTSSLFDRSPLRTSVQIRTTGIASKTPLDDRVFHKATTTGGVPNTKPHIRKKFALPDCQGSPTKVKPMSPKMKRVKPTRVPGLDGASAVSSSGRSVAFESDSFTLAFEGPRSFQEAQKIAATAFTDDKPSEQDQEDCVCDVKNRGAELVQCAISHRTKSSRPGSCPERRSRPETSSLGVFATHSHSLTHMVHHEHSDPKLDERNSVEREQFFAYGATGGTLPPSPTETTVDGAGAAGSGARPPSEADDGDGDGNWETYDEADDVTSPQDSPSVDKLDVVEAPSSEQTELEPGGAAGTCENDVQVQEVSVENPAQPAGHSVETVEGEIRVCENALERTADLDEVDEVEVAEVLFDLVDHVAADHLSCESTGSGTMLEARDDTTSSATTSRTSSRRRSSRERSATTFIQSAVRGHQARRAFRLALYQEALRAGVLGAMPGSMQGKSGWYQDPKSLMAYYFAVLPDSGEWQQKLVLRCSRLILTPYEMHEEILSKVFVSQ